MTTTLSRFAVAALALALCSSCIKKPELAGIDSGVKAEALDVQKAVSKAWGNADPALLMRKNDFVYITVEQTIQGYPTTIPVDEGQTVTERNRAVVDNRNVIHHKIAHQVREFKTDGTYDTSTQSEDFDVTDTLPLTAQAVEQSGLSSREAATKALDRLSTRSDDGTVRQRDISFDVAQYLFQVCTLEPTDGTKVECYNLTTSNEVRPAPPLVASQPNCGGLPECLMHVTTVDFDVILTLPDADHTKEKLSYHVAISPDVPYVARVVDFCTSGLVRVQSNDQKIPILVRTCKMVRNFNYGIPDTNL